MKIYNAVGKDVTSITKKILYSDTKIIIDISNLVDGIYYLKTKTATNKVHKK